MHAGCSRLAGGASAEAPPATGVSPRGDAAAAWAWPACRRPSSSFFLSHGTEQLDRAPGHSPDWMLRLCCPPSYQIPVRRHPLFSWAFHLRQLICVWSPLGRPLRGSSRAAHHACLPLSRIRPPAASKPVFHCWAHPQDKKWNPAEQLHWSRHLRSVDRQICLGISLRHRAPNYRSSLESVGLDSLHQPKQQRERFADRRSALLAPAILKP
mmetsp:Transcript_40339/g.101322  ORF Transcript_40339/g.101322 Transcript_40339/m.101322 type:complete len:211 (-) Transcript_40339:124-756(-)